MNSDALTKLRLENLWKLRTAKINRLQLIICHKKEFLSSLNFFYKTCANTQQVLPVQIGLYRYDERMVQDINDKNLNRS